MAGTIDPALLTSQTLWRPETGTPAPSTVTSSGQTGTAAASGPVDTFVTGATPAETTEWSVLQRQMSQIAVSTQIQQASLRRGTDQEGVSLEASQLDFDFVAEMRSEELFRFAQRTGAVAEGLEGGSRTNFIEMSRRMAARFQFSFSVSSVALNGFAGAAEQLQQAGESPEDLVGFTGGVLEKADELLNKAFEIIADFLKGNIDDVGARLKEIFSGLGDLFGSPASTEPGSGTLAQTSQFSFSFQFQFEFSFMQEQAVVQEGDPLVLDLNGNGFDLSDYTNGALFDLQGRGQQVQTAFVRGGDALLAMDRNGNGRIDSGLELFGDQRGARNGYEELARLDTNGDGLITRDDRDFDSLLLWVDNGNGKTDPGELITLREAGITEISLRYQQVNLQASGNNRVTEIGSYRRADGSQGLMGDVQLRYLA